MDETNAADIADICTHLDGLPLAIELVVARIRLLPPRILRRRLLGPTAHSFELLQGGARDAPLRHRTLKDAITWSYDLLTAAEQRLLRMLAVFVGGCTLEAVEHFNRRVVGEDDGCVLNVLASLDNKSLIQHTLQPSGESRFSLLEMVREFALEQLPVNEGFAIARRAHAETYAAFVETAMPALSGPDHLAWIARLNADHDNCRAALHWAIAQQQTELAVRIGSALWSYWLERGYFQEGCRFLTGILQLTGGASRSRDRASVLTGLGAIRRAQGNMTDARGYLDEAISICREAGDALGLALEKYADGCFLDFALDPSRASQLYVEAVELYERAGDWVGAMRVRQQFGMEEYHVGDYVAAQANFEEALAFYEARQLEAELGQALHSVGRALFQQQRFAEANERFTEALSKAQARGDQVLVSSSLYFQGRIAYYQGAYAHAEVLLEESLHVARKLDTRASDIAFPLAFLSKIALSRGDVSACQWMLKESLTLTYAEGHVYAVALILPFCAGLLATLGKHIDAVQLVAAGRVLHAGLGVYLPLNDQAAFDAPLTVVRPLLSAEEFTQAWVAGEQMAMDAAVSLALAEIAGSPSANGTSVTIGAQQGFTRPA